MEVDFHVAHSGDEIFGKVWNIKFPIVCKKSFVWIGFARHFLFFLVLSYSAISEPDCH